MRQASSLPTMKDVAREARVSLGTVSKVMNGIPVGESYRLRVEEASQKLGYQVNSYARGLKSNKTCTVALILPSLNIPFYAELAEKIAGALIRQGYRMVLMITNYDAEAETKSIAMVRQNMMDGIIGLTYNPDLVVDDSVPFVMIDRHCSSNVPCISSDNYGGGQLAAEKLLELGCRRLLFMRIGSDVSSEADKRGVGFESVCRSKDVPFQSLILHDDETEEPFYRYLEEHTRGGIPDFDGIFCNTDRLACHIGQWLRNKGIRIPEDVQIIGYDGTVNYMTGRPFCSTIVQPVTQMAETAVKTLLNQDGDSLPTLICLPVSYAPGGTTKDT